jgi:SagB-type dehydrogenase family enzyme
MGIQRHHGILFFIIAMAVILIFMLIPNHLSIKPNISSEIESKIEIKLPSPVFSSGTSIEEALKKRRSIRVYKNLPLTLQEVAQLLWAAQGITSDNGFRTSPSAGALYPLEIYLVAGNIEKLSSGVYHYVAANHSLEKIKEGDLRIMLSKAAIGQASVKLAAADIVITAVFSRTIQKYGDKGRNFVLMEAGHTAQNIYLQSVSLNLGTVSIGAFNGNDVKDALVIKEEPLYIMPIGKI